MNYVHTGTFKRFKRLGAGLHGRVADVLEWGTDGLKDHDIGEYDRLCDQASEVVEVRGYRLHD